MLGIGPETGRAARESSLSKTPTATCSASHRTLGRVRRFCRDKCDRISATSLYASTLPPDPCTTLSVVAKNHSGEWIKSRHEAVENIPRSVAWNVSDQATGSAIADMLNAGELTYR